MKILLILEVERKDWYTYLRNDLENDYYLLWYESKSEVLRWVEEDTFFKEIYYWNNYSTSKILLSKIKPDRIVFFEIIDQRQIALLVTANKFKIKTVYLAHGASSDVEGTLLRSEQKNYFLDTRVKYFNNRLKGPIINMFISKLFYYSSCIHVNSLRSLLKYLRLPFFMLINTPNKALRYNKFKERAPNKYIVFNNSNFESMATYNIITKDSAILTGIPFFDKYFTSSVSTEKHIIFIDHPYLEYKLLDWTEAFHKKIATTLYNFSKKNNIKCFVRLHPSSDIRMWKSYGYESSLFQFSQNDDFTEKILSSSLILSYSSTLLTGALCARKNIVLLGWHPKPSIFGIDFSRYNICHISFSTTDLEQKFGDWEQNNLSIRKEKDFRNFINELNFPFDGYAAKRVIEEIIN